MEKERVVGILLVIVILALIITIYFNFFYLKKCDSLTCFTNSIVKCQRVSFINEGQETIIQYKILGKEEDKCKINVRLLQLKNGQEELSNLENQAMDCFIPFGVLVYPESNLKDCHGLLKENIQEIIIDRMHNQIVQNLGKIKEETTKGI